MFGALSIILSLTTSAFADEWTCTDYATTPDELVHLETQATRGALLRRDLDCLETGYRKASVMTTKDKISRVLLVNAYARDTELLGTVGAAAPQRGESIRPKYCVFVCLPPLQHQIG